MSRNDGTLSSGIYSGWCQPGKPCFPKSAKKCGHLADCLDSSLSLSFAFSFALLQQPIGEHSPIGWGPEMMKWSTSNFGEDWKERERERGWSSAAFRYWQCENVTIPGVFSSLSNESFIRVHRRHALSVKSILNKDWQVKITVSLMFNTHFADRILQRVRSGFIIVKTMEICRNGGTSEENIRPVKEIALLRNW